MKRVHFLNLQLVLVFLSFNLFGQNAPTVEAQITQLKSFYNLQDYEGGYNFGKSAVESYPENSELQAWLVLNFAHYEVDEAVVYAKNLADKKPDNSWANYANIYTLIRHGKAKQALPLTEKLLESSPENEDFIFLKAAALYQLDENDQGLDLLNKNEDSIKNKSKFLILKGEFLYNKSTTEKDQQTEELKKKSFESFAEAQKADLNNLDALYITGFYLNQEKRFAEAAQILQKATRISPKSLSVRREYWKTIIEGKTGEIPASKQTELTAEINSFLKISPDSPKVLNLIYQTYLRAGMSKEKEAAEKTILKKFPFSSEAESFLVSQIYRFLYDEKGNKIDAKKWIQAEKMLWDFINRPKHFKVENLEGIYTELFSFAKDDKSFTDQDLLMFAGKAVSENPDIGAEFYPNLVNSLIERNLLAEAEKYARLGIEATEASLKTRYEYLKDEAVRQDFEREFRNAMLGAFGKVLFRQKKYNEAESSLIKSESFKYLGEMYAAQDKFDKAENAYISYLANAYKQDEAWKVIKEFYRKRNGSLSGYEKFEEKVKGLEAAQRREKILAQKIKQPKDTVPFNLKDINGKPINFEDFKGKIIVVNAWGTWCSPCVVEMPELQKLYKKYTNDKDVAILTIAADDIKNVQKFMTEKKYSFPVIMGENYFAQVGINVFPTTWFIDKNGKISYIKISSSPKLLEEFSWRIESLR